MLEFISPHRPDDATEVAQSWLRGHAGEDEPRELARVGARHLLVRGERATWEPVWEVMEGDRAFGRAVFDDGTWFVERVQRRLREVETELLVRAWRWTVREWPYPVGNIEVGVVEEGRDLRDALLRELLRRAGIGRPDALTSLRQIAAEPTAPEGLPFGLARAEHEAKMRRWEPWTLADIRRTDPVPAQEALDDAGPKEG
jgi:hypothetical protein